VTRDLWRAPATIAAGPLLIVSLLFLSGDATGPSFYGVSRLAQVSSALPIIVPFCAGLAAWEGARLRMGGAFSVAPVRSELAIAGRALLPIGCLALLGIAASAAAMLSTGPSLALGDLRILIVPLAAVAGYSALAYAAGRYLPGAFAIPGAVVGSWLLIVYPVAVEPLWIRHLTGYLSSCCDLSTVPDPGAMIAPIIVAAGMCAAAGLLVSPLAPTLRIGLAGLAVVGAVGVATTFVTDLGSEATTPRNASALTCRGDRPRICLWPENEPVLHTTAAAASAIRDRLTASGVRVPSTVSESLEDRGKFWFVSLVPDARKRDVEAGLIMGLIPAVPACANGRAPYPGFAAQAPLEQWLAAIARVPSGSSLAPASRRTRREVAAVRQQPRAEQLSWYRQNLRAVSKCGPHPRLLTQR